MSKMMTICFPHGGIIPASVLGLEKDKACAALEAVDVPEVYGQHLIDDRFAIKAEKPKGEKKSSNAAAEKAAQVAAEKAAVLAAAEQAVKDAEAAVAAAGEDLVAKAAATEALEAAKAALAALKA